MHWKNVARREQIIHDRENGLLHLARVAAAGDDDQSPGEAHYNQGLRARTVALRVGEKFRHAQHGELRMMLLQLLIAGTDEHGTHEEVLPGLSIDDAYGKAITGIGASIKVLDKEFAATQVLND